MSWAQVCGNKAQQTQSATAAAGGGNGSTSNSDENQKPQQQQQQQQQTKGGASPRDRIDLTKFKYTKPVQHTSLEAHIPMMEAELVSKATIKFSELFKKEADKQRANKREADEDEEEDDFPVSTGLTRILDELGFAIVTDVVDQAELSKIEKQWGQDLLSIIEPPKTEQQKKQMQQSKTLAAIKADPVLNWPMDRLQLGTKFASYFGLPHAPSIYNARTNPNVKTVFASIFGVSRAGLCSSYDNVFFSNAACEESVDDARVSNLWLHADQNKHADAKKTPGGDLLCLQGILYIWPADIDTSATVVVPGSHKATYEELMSGQDWSTRGHFCQHPKPRQVELAKKARRIPVPSGSLLLWNSRTSHQGSPNGPRFAIPTCWMPKAQRSDGAASAKMSIIRAGQPTPHWPIFAKAHSMARDKESTPCESEPCIVLQSTAHNHVFADSNRKKLRPEILSTI